MLDKRRRTSTVKRNVYAPLETKRPTHAAPLPIYALTCWSVKKLNGKWCIAPTARFEDKPAWSKPYATLQGATTAIARKLAEEALARHKRRCKHYGIND